MNGKNSKCLARYNATELLLLNICGGSDFQTEIDQELDRRAMIGMSQEWTEDYFHHATFCRSNLALLS